MILHDKHCMFQRLQWMESEGTTVAVVLNQIQRSFRKYIRAADPENSSQLLAIAMDIEREMTSNRPRYANFGTGNQVKYSITL